MITKVGYGDETRDGLVMITKVESGRDSDDGDETRDGGVSASGISNANIRKNKITATATAIIHGEARNSFLGEKICSCLPVLHARLQLSSPSHATCSKLELKRKQKESNKLWGRLKPDVCGVGSARPRIGLSPDDGVVIRPLPADRWAVNNTKRSPKRQGRLRRILKRERTCINLHDLTVKLPRWLAFKSSLLSPRDRVEFLTCTPSHAQG
ncbi:hypothetical protein RRG08_034951 [Elysia crispata]|uniref:Uncharacterized protein n=1 Tax=Elysia crispata TaxID=231223 RepID=A0AAE1CRF0_9GAST|nr:hypothetical protein RRG08_034951 [Elysia crispata]